MRALLAVWLLGQAAGGATLRVTVVDQTGAVVVGATVTVTGAEAQTTATVVPDVSTDGTGVASFTALRPGRYTISTAFPGFDTRVISGVRLRAGDNRQVAVLTIQRVQADVTVELDRQQSASDRRGPAFGSTLTRDQIEALSDDPAVLQQQLQDMAGPGAVIRIDGFEGGPLPPKAMIRSIRISRDQFAAEFHSAGAVSIEIITQPGAGPLQFFSNFLVRPNPLIGRSPFVPVRGAEQSVNYGFGSNGTLRKAKSSFFLNVFGLNAYDTPNLNAARPDGARALALNVRTPRHNLSVNGQVDYAVTLDQTLRVGYSLSRFTQRNLGIGGYDEPERAFGTDNTVHTARLQHSGPLGRRAFWRSRAQLMWSDSDAQSVLETTTIRVLDAFTTGDAQRAGGDHGRTVNLASDLDYVRGRHSMRVGLVLDSTWYRSDSVSNYLGTYTFNTLDAFLASAASNYSRRVGDPTIGYRMIQAGMYLQDDIRIRKGLSVTPGIRYELQSHINDLWNIGPRFGVTWAPTADGQTTMRASAGMFYDWLSTSTYDQVVRVDGSRQREINLVDPPSAIEDAEAAETVVPLANRYLLGRGYDNPRLTRLSAGIERAFKRVNRVSATYGYVRGSRLARGRNVNAAVGGVRPDPSLANVVDVVADGASRQHQLQLDATINPGAGLPAPNGPRISWKRTSVFANYTLGSLRNNTDGAFTVSPTGVLSTEWGPASGGGMAGPMMSAPGVIVFGGGVPLVDVRHRGSLAVNTQAVRNLLVGTRLIVSSAPPYTMLTGRDDNGDGIFNDRPAGIPRNALRAGEQLTCDVFVGYNFAFGRSTRPLPPGIAVFGTGGTAQVRTVDLGPARYRAQVTVSVQNVTNRPNYVGYSGTMTSPFFGRPTAVSAMRKVDISMNFSF